MATYNQGIYAATALAARKASIETDPEVVAKAIEGYQGLVLKGRLTFSLFFPYKDLSSLFGEFLALSIFQEALLPDETVISTLEAHPKTPFGYPVVVREDNSYLGPQEFNRPYPPGDYHNGAEWTFFSAIAHATAELHGGRHDFGFWLNLFSRLQETNHAEYIQTNRAETGPGYPPSQVQHLWNTACYFAAKMVLSEEELREIHTAIYSNKVPSPHLEAADFTS